MPGLEGGTNWFPIAANPEKGIVYLNTNDWAMSLKAWKPEDVDLQGRPVYMGVDYQMYRHKEKTGYLKAFDVANKKWLWELPSPLPMFAGVLATKGGLVFTGDQLGFFKAVDADTGKELWKFQTGSGINASPITYELDGKQYVADPLGPGRRSQLLFLRPEGRNALGVRDRRQDQGHDRFNPQIIEKALPVYGQPCRPARLAAALASPHARRRGGRGAAHQPGPRRPRPRAAGRTSTASAATSATSARAGAAPTCSPRLDDEAFLMTVINGRKAAAMPAFGLQLVARTRSGRSMPMSGRRTITSEARRRRRDPTAGGASAVAPVHAQEDEVRRVTAEVRGPDILARSHGARARRLSRRPCRQPRAPFRPGRGSRARGLRAPTPPERGCCATRSVAGPGRLRQRQKAPRLGHGFFLGHLAASAGRHGPRRDDCSAAPRGRSLARTRRPFPSADARPAAAAEGGRCRTHGAAERSPRRTSDPPRSRARGTSHRRDQVGRGLALAARINRSVANASRISRGHAAQRLSSPRVGPNDTRARRPSANNPATS